MYCSEACDEQNNKGGAQWLPILDCRDNYNLAVTPPGMWIRINTAHKSNNLTIKDSSNSKWRTAKFDPSNVNQLWRQDMSGRLINKGNGKAFRWDRYGARFVVNFI